ncbi:uncharacterized protein PV07_02383 [Cladophialophora immunda]|uniref:Glyoxalase/fosfomycin resistance/dioxygenase domain-containing protein n=1 Tax=Cladophialophora immunda TaxID=569365 RepID=A0A0D2DJ16_9EURO|nr:uncharacterized protein PV07_02383 [Cladophialophora immunda]KIW35699.1 hypothetical protein PV07_02383 [Cladophialophora immunda]OQV04992.1 Glyoxalase-like domain-containing protein [Cladophialophora immunda]
MPYVQTTFLNLPISDLSQSIAFYTSLGFVQNHTFSSSTSAMVSLPIPTHFATPHESPIKIMLLCHDFFNTFLPPNRTLADAKKTTQMLFCVSRESREAVDEMVEKAAESGAKVDICKKNEAQEKAEKDSGMYGRNFEDPDGHIVEVVYMPVQCYEGKE